MGRQGLREGGEGGRGREGRRKRRRVKEERGSGGMRREGKIPGRFTANNQPSLSTNTDMTKIMRKRELY